MKFVRFINESEKIYNFFFLVPSFKSFFHSHIYIAEQLNNNLILQYYTSNLIPIIHFNLYLHITCIGWTNCLVCVWQSVFRYLLMQWILQYGKITELNICANIQFAVNKGWKFCIFQIYCTIFFLFLYVTLNIIYCDLNN